MVETMHRRLKEAMRARQGDDWHQHLPWVLLGLRSAPKEDPAVSAAGLAFGTPLVLLGELMGAPPATEADLVRDLRSDLVSFALLPVRKVPAAREDTAVPAVLLQATFVYLRSEGAVPPLAARYQGPDKVLGTGPQFFRLQLGGLHHSRPAEAASGCWPCGAGPAPPPRAARN